jgi:hypothetical protein
MLRPEVVTVPLIVGSVMTPEAKFKPLTAAEESDPPVIVAVLMSPEVVKVPMEVVPETLRSPPTVRLFEAVRVPVTVGLVITGPVRVLLVRVSVVVRPTNTSLEVGNVNVADPEIRLATLRSAKVEESARAKRSNRLEGPFHCKAA